MKRFLAFVGLVAAAGFLFTGFTWKLPIYWMNQHHTDHRSLICGDTTVAAGDTVAISSALAGYPLHSLCLNGIASSGTGSVEIAFKDVDCAHLDTFTVALPLPFGQQPMGLQLLNHEFTRDVYYVIIRQSTEDANFWWSGLSDDE